MEAWGQVADAVEDVGLLRTQHEIFLVGDEDGQFLIVDIDEFVLRRGEDEHTADGASAADDVD